MVTSFQLKGFVLVIGLLFGQACSRKEIEPKPLNKKCVITKAVVAGAETTSFTYDTSQRVQQIYHDFTVEDDFTEVYEYGNTGNISKISYVTPPDKVLAYLTFTYNQEGLIIKESYFSNKGNENADFFQVYDLLLEYNSKKQVVKASRTHPGNTEQPDRFQIFQYDATGNVIQVEEHRQGIFIQGLYKTTRYSYDNNLNPTFGAVYLGVDPVNLSRNNVLTETETTHVPDISTKVTTHSYAYTTDSYPVRRVGATGNQMKQTRFEYACFN